MLSAAMYLLAATIALPLVPSPFRLVIVQRCGLLMLSLHAVLFHGRATSQPAEAIPCTAEDALEKLQLQGKIVLSATKSGEASVDWQ